MTDDFDDQAGGTKRAVRKDVQLSRDAAGLMLPVNDKIGRWQAAAVRLGSVGERLKLRGQTSAAHVAEAQALHAEVSAERTQFELDLAALPAELRGHGRVDDTVKAFDSLLATVARVAKLFG